MKKPLMTKVSMRHLNEIVRERNQYSRDTFEAWQDYINLKGRLDTELAKVNKRNNFLVEELESWKQQVGDHGQLSWNASNDCSSSLNSKHLLSNSRKRHKTSKLRSSLISVRIVVSPTLSNNIRRMLHVLQFVFLAPRSNVTTPWKRWFFSKRLQRNLKENARGIRRISPLFNTQTRT